MISAPRNLSRPVWWTLLLACTTGVLAAGTLFPTLRSIAPADWWTDVSAPEESIATSADFAVSPMQASTGAARLSMRELLNGLLFHPASSWRLESSKTVLEPALLTEQFAPIAATSTNTFRGASFSAGFVTNSPSLMGPVPADPNGGPTITGIWISNASGNWGTATNWQGGTVPQGSSALARFDTLNITTNVTVTNEVARTIGDIFVGDTNGTNTYNITGATIIFENIFDGRSDLHQIATSAGDTISAPFLITTELTVTNSSSNVLTLSGAISSNAPANTSAGIEFVQGNVNVTGNISDASTRPIFVHVDAGVVTLSGTNSYTRQTSINGGTLLVNGDNSASTGTVFVSGMGSVLGGTGKIGADVLMFDQSTITGGTTTTVGTLTLQHDVLMVTGEGAGGIYLANLSGSTSDLLAITGQFVLGANSTLNIQGTADGTTTYILATFGSHSDTFEFVSGIPANYSLVYNATDLELVPVPEPATWIGGALALGTIAFAARPRLRRR